MRDIVLMMGVLALFPFILRKPFIGVLAWSWISIMTPHKLAYGFSHSLRINLLIVLLTFIAFLADKEKKRFPSSNLFWLYVGFILWTSISVIFAADFIASGSFYLDHIIKIALHMVVMVLLVNSKHRLMCLIWVIVLSLGWHAFKTGSVTILKGGVIGGLAAFGPSGTMIEDRNHFALAMLMACPLFFYLSKYSQLKLMRVGCFFAIIFAILAVVGSQSRGGFATMILMLSYLWLQTKGKFITGPLLVLVAAGGFALIPPEIKERMLTILDQTQTADVIENPTGEDNYDGSLCLRLAIWQVGWDMVKTSPIIGKGPRAIQNAEVASKYLSEKHICSDNPKYGPRAAHNIYMEVLTDSGFVGLFLFVMLIIGSWFSAVSLKRKTRKAPELRWAYDLGAMLQVSIFAYATGGMLLSMAYYDVFHIIIVILAITHQLVREEKGLSPPRRVFSHARSQFISRHRRRRPA